MIAAVIEDNGVITLAPMGVKFSYEWLNHPKALRLLSDHVLLTAAMEEKHRQPIPDEMIKQTIENLEKLLSLFSDK